MMEWNLVQKRALRLKASHYMLKKGILYRRNYQGIYLKCITQEDAHQIINNFHEKFGSGHPSGNVTSHRILRARYYWPTIFKDAHRHIRTYHKC